MIKKLQIFLIVSISFCLSASGQDTTAKFPPNTNARIVFLLDVSNSMARENKMKLLKNSTEELLKLLDKNDQISLLSFGAAVEKLYHTASYSGPDSILKILSKIRSTASSTNINGGIYEAYETMFDKKKKKSVKRKEVPTFTEKHVLLITDGLFELNPYTKQMVCDHPEIKLTCVIVGRGIEADKAVTYVREELQLRVITLVDEEKDVKKLTEIFEYQNNKKGQL